MDAADLYRLPPEDFTAARDAAVNDAKAAGDKERAAELKALRRPSVSAFLVNGLAKQDDQLLVQLLELGPALAEAQASGQGDALRVLGAQRRELVQAVISRAVEIGRRDITSAVREEVVATLQAALADPASADAVRSGRLVRALSYAGFGDVDLEGAVAQPRSVKQDKQAPDQQRQEVAKAETAALEAAGALDDAARACEQAERERARAEEQAAAALQEVERLQDALSEAEQVAREADTGEVKASKRADTAVAAVRRAQSQEEQARAELDRLRRRS